MLCKFVPVGKTSLWKFIWVNTDKREASQKFFSFLSCIAGKISLIYIKGGDKFQEKNAGLVLLSFSLFSTDFIPSSKAKKVFDCHKLRTPPVNIISYWPWLILDIHTFIWSGTFCHIKGLLNKSSKVKTMLICLFLNLGV